MPVRSKDLHGNVPDASNTALLLIDVVNDFEFEGGEQLLELALPVGKQISELKSRAAAAGIPAIYVNDNFGIWRSDLNRIVSHCTEEDVRGKPFVELILPDENDYFVLKPKHSGFYCTTLELLLEHLGATKLILTGIAGNNCVLFTANDAYMRDFHLFVPSDTTVSLSPEDNKHALQQMEKVLKADVSQSSQLNLEEMKNARRSIPSEPGRS
jgi:nicotinamidase-related amidase